jgi:hypothetical protein
MFAGLYRTTLDIGFTSMHCSHVFAVFEGGGLLVVSWISNSKGCKKGIVIGGVVAVLGIFTALYPILAKKVEPLKSVGLGMIRMSVSVQPTLILCIISELTTPRIIQIVFCLSMIMHNVGRSLGAIIYNNIKH